MAGGRVEPPSAQNVVVMTDRTPLAWLNGRRIPYTEAAVPVWDLGVVAGATVSEMARTYRHQPFRMQHHIARLCTSCRELGFLLPYSESELVSAATTIVEANSRSLTDTDDLGIVWFVTAGPNQTYLTEPAAATPTVCVHTFRLPFQQWQEAVRSGVRLVIPDQRQLPACSFPVQHKTRNRLHWWLADRAAAKMQPNSRALLLDGQDQITETSTACFYGVIEDAVVTARTSVLRSTTRDFVRELCDRIGIHFRFAELAAGQLGEFQEAFLSSTPCGLLPVSSIDDRQLPGPAGAVLQQLQAEWSRVTGVDTFRQILHQPTQSGTAV